MSYRLFLKTIAPNAGRFCTEDDVAIEIVIQW